MKIRLISAGVALLILIPIVIFSDTAVLPAAVAIVSSIALFEMFRCCGVHKRIVFSLPYYIAATAVPTCIYLSVNNIVSLPLEGICLLSMFVLIIWTYPSAVFSKGTVAVTDACTASLGSIYIIAGLNSILFIRQGLEAGVYIFPLIFLGAWITDSAAYFCGRAFGKHKLIPEVSPKKTVEGSVGGIIFCVIFFALYGLLVQFMIGKGEVSVNYVALLVSSFFISVVSQIGDLAMSLLKRHYGIKDFGKIMPGHGGVLDRFDSILAASTILLICCAVAETVAHVQLFSLITA
ncbi:MAG: CDP-archaeol synthase [Clostridia bacterium]|nr:CDP-archaeol synthase [Clostridia bacterium]